MKKTPKLPAGHKKGEIIYQLWFMCPWKLLYLYKRCRATANFCYDDFTCYLLLLTTIIHRYWRNNKKRNNHNNNVLLKVLSFIMLHIKTRRRRRTFYILDRLSQSHDWGYYRHELIVKNPPILEICTKVLLLICYHFVIIEGSCYFLVYIIVHWNQFDPEKMFRIIWSIIRIIAKS